MAAGEAWYTWTMLFNPSGGFRGLAFRKLMDRIRRGAFFAHVE